LTWLSRPAAATSGAKATRIRLLGVAREEFDYQFDEFAGLVKLRGMTDNFGTVTAWIKEDQRDEK
jgi:hypothetical protein